MTPDYLDFDYSEDADGNGSFDAMASVAPQQLPAVHAEIAAVLAWAHDAFAGRRGATDDGGEWDFDLQSHQEFSVPETMRFEEATGMLTVQPGEPGAARHVVSLSIGGSPAFCDALRTQFEIA
ncbi:MAG: hypothetical protein EOP79_01010 [Variovorax sp.]|nr:MAG: hypothetical protein EOP79_01010 [Variovorax sp.]